MKKSVLSFLLALILAAGSWILFPITAKAEKVDLVTVNIRIDNGTTVPVYGYESNYKNNLYLSMRSLASALSGTRAQFNFYTDEEGFYYIETGAPYDASTEPVDETGAKMVPLDTDYLGKNSYWLMVDDRSVTYFNFAEYRTDDLYVSMLNTQMMLDLHMTYQDGVYNLDTSGHFQADLNKMKEQGYFDYLHGAALGDITTGELLFSCHGDRAVPIASTTKLMTYMVVKRLMELGKFSESDMATVSANAARLSVSDDAVMYMYEGEEISVHDLIYAMLIQSSNESALALAEYAAGSQKAFVAFMNLMAFRLGLTSAKFYNPHGLPEYLEGDLPVMVENQMSAEDMLKLAQAVLRKYPEIEEITSQDTVWLDDLWITLSNTNLLMRNMPDVFGLKTGTTDAAEKCLVSARRVQVNGETHILVAVVLGAEFNSDRIEISELLLKSQGY